jgi:hypothetical protein
MVLSTAVLSAVLLVGVGVAQASHSWGTYHWARTANPFTLKMGDNVSTSWDSYLTQTSDAWSLSSVLDTTVVAGLGGKNCKAQTGRIEVCSRTYGYNGWLGLAQIYISGSHITKGIAKMNDSYFNLPTYNTPDERLHVMCQEVGHLFGLGHTSEDGTSQGTCMDYSSSPESTLPNAHDYEQLEAIYAHLDTVTTVGSTATGGRGASVAARSDDFENASEWGKEIHRSADGHASVFERDLGHDERVLTHVRWAE